MANGDIVVTQALANRALPSAISDNANGAIRMSRRGELVTQMTGRARHTLADQGTYFSFHNITNDAATTLAGHAAPVLVDADATMTKPFLHMINAAASTSLVRAYLDFIEIEVITAGAAGTADSWAAQLDTGATRYSSGTVETLTMVNPNMQSSATPVTVAKAGPFVSGVESANARNLGFGQFRPTIQIAGDKYLFVFGGEPDQIGSTSIATIAHHVVGLPPVILGPTDQLLLALYSPSQSGAGVYKIRGGFWEL